MKYQRQTDPSDTKLFRAALLRWFAQNRRPDPWQQDPTPYSVWIAEVMLQQTLVKAVVPYFVSWMKRFPDIDALAHASEQEVLRQWEGLGYYSRARNLHRSARIVVRDFAGKLPDEYEKLLRLPGIGDYTASAILSIAFGKPFPVVDANVRRVVRRFLAIRDLNSAGEQRIHEFLKLAISHRKPGTFNESLMQLGQAVCRNREPLCDACPMRNKCQARALGLQSKIPERNSSRSIHKSSIVLVLLARQRLLLSHNKRGMFAGMWSLPKVEARGGQSLEPIKRFLRKLEVREYEIVRRLKLRAHSYTKYTDKLVPVVITSDQADLLTAEGFRWVPFRELDSYPLPAIHRKIIADSL